MEPLTVVPSVTLSSSSVFGSYINLHLDALPLLSCSHIVVAATACVMSCSEDTVHLSANTHRLQT